MLTYCVNRTLKVQLLGNLNSQIVESFTQISFCARYVTDWSFNKRNLIFLGIFIKFHFSLILRRNIFHICMKLRISRILGKRQVCRKRSNEKVQKNIILQVKSVKILKRRDNSLTVKYFLYILKVFFYTDVYNFEAITPVCQFFI